MSSYQLYASIPRVDWAGDLKSRFPHAPLVNGYRVLVFTNAETEQFKADDAERGIVELSSSGDIIEHMEGDLKPWVILQVEPLREVMQYFNPPSDEVI